MRTYSMTTSDIKALTKTEGCQVLAVDDDPIVLDLLETFITSIGHICTPVTDGESALRMLKTKAFDLVVTDMVMPGVDGMELLRYIRSNIPDTDVIVVTGHPASFSFTQVIQAGAIDFITKPFLKDELEAKINRVLRERYIIKKLEQLSRKDSLTGLFNRRFIRY